MSREVTTAINVEQAVLQRYSNAARRSEADLCCPAPYDAALLGAIPQEVLARDYGCGNPTSHVRPGETVLDLGSGSGKACFMASQVVGPEGRVIGIDFNDEMLDLARRNAPEAAHLIGHANVEFRKGHIQDLGLDLERLGRYLERYPVDSVEALRRLEEGIATLRVEHPLVASDSVDVVISSCVLNLVRPEDKPKLFREIFRVLKRGGRAVISDIVSDEPVPGELQRDPELWSGCISGAMLESEFLRAFEEAGFHGISLVSRQVEPWRTVRGIEFRSVTVSACKGKQGPCLDQKHAVIYRGPFREVLDDDGHLMKRGFRTAVCEKTYRILSQEPYLSHFELVPPRVSVPLEEAPPFPCTGGTRLRDARETKGADYVETNEAGRSVCGSSDGPGCC